MQEDKKIPGRLCGNCKMCVKCGGTPTFDECYYTQDKIHFKAKKRTKKT